MSSNCRPVGVSGARESAVTLTTVLLTLKPSCSLAWRTLATA
ncbi:MAG: hypothetical protein VSS75_001530 [Candidatus Parabeggiatoa sp.]|nr:hypothetical protein [Candidatus Parabeggiatoa sp.]